MSTFSPNPKHERQPCRMHFIYNPTGKWQHTYQDRHTRDPSQGYCSPVRRAKFSSTNSPNSNWAWSKDKAFLFLIAWNEPINCIEIYIWLVNWCGVPFSQGFLAIIWGWSCLHNYSKMGWNGNISCWAGNHLHHDSLPKQSQGLRSEEYKLLKFLWQHGRSPWSTDKQYISCDDPRS